MATSAGQFVAPRVRELTAADAAQWTDFVAAHPDATLYHTLLWRDVVQEVFGHRPIYLLCERAEGVSGVLPLFLVEFPVLGKKLVSLPYDVGSGGPLGRDVDSEAALARQAMALAREFGVNHLELRCGARRDALERLPLQRSEPLIISDMELTGEPEVWSRVSSDHRQSLRKAEKRGMRIREATTLADVGAFYEVYLRAFREFGTPPYGRSYFPTVWRRLRASGAVRLLLAEADGRCVGGLVLYCWGKALVSKFAACLAEAVPLRAYAALYGRAIALGLAEGYHRLSWGTSARHQRGLIEFKEKWGATSHAAVIYGLSVRRALPAIERYYDAGGLARRVWRRLPLGATRLGGTVLNQWFC